MGISERRRPVPTASSPSPSLLFSSTVMCIIYTYSVLLNRFGGGGARATRTHSNDRVRRFTQTLVRACASHGDQHGITGDNDNNDNDNDYDNSNNNTVCYRRGRRLYRYVYNIIEETVRRGAILTNALASFHRLRRLRRRRQQ